MITTRPGIVRGAPSVRSMRAMASPITLSVVAPGPRAQSCLDRAVEVVRDVERTCSRFDPASALSRANAEPDRWHDVPATLAAAIGEAEHAHCATDGVFDPRVLETLLEWGYDTSLRFAGGHLAHQCPDVAPVAPRPDHTAPWRPRIVQRHGAWRVHLGGTPVDLGGIGKGLAVRWAAAQLAPAGPGYLVDAGGDCALGGLGPEGGRWRVGVEDPAGGEHLAVLELTDTACATSSIRRRRWVAHGQPVHHLVDPVTRRPGGVGLTAVTVVAPDPAWAEVWSKTLFLAGAAGIRARADDLGLAALWAHQDGTVGTTQAMDSWVIWRSAHA